jgi:hypothetical protein
MNERTIRQDSGPGQFEAGSQTDGLDDATKGRINGLGVHLGQQGQFLQRIVSCAGQQGTLQLSQRSQQALPMLSRFPVTRLGAGTLLQGQHHRRSDRSRLPHACRGRRATRR